MPDPARTHVVDESYSVDIAQGILMERYEIGPGGAYQIMLRHAEQRRLPIIEMAHWLIATRRLL